MVALDSWQQGRPLVQPLALILNLSCKESARPEKKVHYPTSLTFSTSIILHCLLLQNTPTPMKITSCILLGVALQLLTSSSSTVEGLPFDNKAATFENWRKTIDHARNQTGIPGLSVAVLHKGEIIFAEGFGIRNKNNDPVNADVRICFRMWLHLLLLVKVLCV
jgi:hypothetical protein